MSSRTKKSRLPNDRFQLVDEYVIKISSGVGEFHYIRVNPDVIISAGRFFAYLINTKAHILLKYNEWMMKLH